MSKVTGQHDICVASHACPILLDIIQGINGEWHVQGPCDLRGDRHMLALPFYSREAAVDFSVGWLRQALESLVKQGVGE